MLSRSTQIRKTSTLKGFPIDSRHSNVHKLCPSPSRHIYVLKRSGIYTVFALSCKENVSVSVQLHIQLHRWRIFNQKPWFWELFGSDVSRWAWDQRHDGEQQLCFLLGFLILSIGKDGQLRTSFYDKRDDFNFNIETFRSWGAIFNIRQPMAFLSPSSYGMPGLNPDVNVLI